MNNNLLDINVIANFNQTCKSISSNIYIPIVNLNANIKTEYTWTNRLKYIV